MADIMPPVPPARSLPDRPVGWELLLFVLVLLLIVVVGVFVLAALGDVAFGPQSGAALRRGLPDPNVPGESWIYLGAFALFYLAVIAATWIAMFPHRGRRALALRLVPATWPWFVFGTIAVLALSQALDVLLLPFLRDAMAIGGDELQVTLLIRALTGTPALTVLAIAVLALLAPVAEELVFRGLLHGWLRGFLPFALVAVLTSVLFGLAHGEAAHAIAAGLLGLVLAGIREYSGSLWPAIVAHVANNLVAVGTAAMGV
ncbi:MAG: lysostaphin resistance A-like protein [Reyranellaceae bacterium]